MVSKRRRMNGKYGLMVSGLLGTYFHHSSSQHHAHQTSNGEG